MKIVFLSLFFYSFSLCAHIKKGISVQLDRGLELGTLVSGDGIKVIDPNRGDLNDSARFKVFGEPNTSFTFVLPERVNLSHASQPANQLIIADFTSMPANRVGTLNSNGESYIYVGGSVSIPTEILPGEYRGHISVEVLYE